MDILFPLNSVLDTELCWSPIPEIIHFSLFAAFSLMFLIILRPYFTPREPSSGPPREKNSKNDQAEVGEWIRIRNRYITSKDYRILLKEVENLEVYAFLLKKCLKKLPREGSSHHLPCQDHLGPVHKQAPARNHRPRGGRGKASPTSFHVSPRAPPAPLASMPSSVPKTSVGSFESLSSLSSSKPPEPLRPLKHPSHRPSASTLSPNPTTSVESLGSLSSLCSSQRPQPLHPLERPSYNPCGHSPPRRRNPGWVSRTDSMQADSKTDVTICPMCNAPECSCLHSWSVPSSPRVIQGVGRCSDPDLGLSGRQEVARAWCLCTSTQYPFEHPNLPTHPLNASF
ncbi:PREDICTED: putative uncharacterized protein C5orf60 isoform X1 [Rhinopithecus bieti]|uniref:putative uncharacterized protein C5orf60 isoform X1 n=2 Tax=Rhinopithecus bieti TaxID=61621 RepID=UPI00083C0F8D|nr:PREDICTED: putative uncharacterized protein C5orf60 isoform X1 [Rhinopithecus bieti]